MIAADTLIEYEPQPKQQLMHSCPANEILFGGSAGPGKAVSVHTPIPTPDGWSEMGMLGVGDYVLSETGMPCMVVWASEVFNEPTYRVLFSDGEEVVAGARHQWVTRTQAERRRLLNETPEWREKRRAKRASRTTGRKSAAFTAAIISRNKANPTKVQNIPTSGIRTTEEIAATLKFRSGSNHSVDVAMPLILPHSDLPIDPYVLGAWLGDGTSSQGSITGIDEEIFTQVANGGYVVTRRTNPTNRGVLGLMVQLRTLGVLCNKHIPSIYLRASKEQRLALLQGLMDTDGCCNTDGSCEISLTNKALAMGTHELILSLGAKCTFRESTARLYGKAISPCYRMAFLMPDPAFRLKRKLVRQKRAGFRGTHVRRYIVAVEYIGDNVPLKCIQVDSPSHCYLVGRGMIPTHNSHSIRYHGLRWGLEIPGLQVYLFRRTYPELERNHILQIQSEWGKKYGEWHDGKKRYVIGNGSKVHACYAQYDKDVLDYHGAEIHLLLIDELTTFTEWQYTYLRNRVRCTLEIPAEYRHLIPGIVCGTNPGGVGHEFCKRMFVDFCRIEESAVADQMKAAGMPVYEHVSHSTGKAIQYGLKRAPKSEGGMMRAYIPSLLEDNKILMERDPGYVDRVKAMPEPYRSAYLDGDWELFIGQAFSFNRKHHVIKPFPVPDYAPLYWTFDWGFGKPYSIGWWFCDADGRLFRFSELYGFNGTPDQGIRQTDSEIAEAIIAHEKELGLRNAQGDWQSRHIVRLCDPTCFNKKPDYKGGGQGESTAEVFVKFGIIMQPGDPNRVLKIRQFHERLKVPKDGTMPMMMIFDTCHHFIRTIPLLQMDQHKPEDVDTKLEDHCYDEAAHACMARPLSLVLPPAKQSSYDQRIAALKRGDADSYEQYAQTVQSEVMRDLQGSEWDGIDDGEEYDDGQLISTVR